MIIIDNEYNFEQIVYLKTDIDQFERIVTGIMHRPGCLKYELSCGTGETWHYGFEITKEKNVTMILT